MTVTVYQKDGTKVDDLSTLKVPIDIQKELFDKIFNDRERREKE